MTDKERIAMLENALERIARLYENSEMTIDHANNMYNARCIARTALQAKEPNDLSQ
jgi:hypothetical protein